MTRPHPPAYPHGELCELFPDVFFVSGTTRMPGPVTVTCSRNMVVSREGGSLTLVNSLRLDERGLTALERLGKVENVIRLAGFHGMDDAFYRERYGAEVYAVEGQFYATGFSTDVTKADVYFEPQVWMNEDTPLPIKARLVRFRSVTPGEAVLLVEKEGGFLITGDSLQNWAAPDPYFNLLGRVSFRLLGFFKPCNVGPGWLKQVKPDVGEVKALLDLEWKHVLPCHGPPVLGDAKVRYRPTIEAL